MLLLTYLFKKLGLLDQISITSGFMFWTS
jgi:hypothetical protein